MSKRSFRVTEIVLLCSILTAVCTAIVGTAAGGCRHQGVRPDSFIGAVVDCSAQGGAAATSITQVVACLSANGGPTSPAAVSCLADVANGLGATVAEITCVVDRLAGDPYTAAPTAHAAAEFLSANRVIVRGGFRAAKAE